MSIYEQLHQVHEHLNTFFQHSQRLQFIQPMRFGKNITAYLEHSSQRTVRDKLFFDRISNEIRPINSLSNGLTENHTYLTSGASFGWHAEDRSWFVTLDMKAQHFRRRGITILPSNQKIRNTFTYLLPFILAKWELNQNSSLDFFYQTHVNQPTSRQLQPFIDNRHSLKIYKGNPALTPEYLYDLNLQYQMKPDIGLNFGISAGADYTHNRIVRVQTTDQQLRQHISEINQTGGWSGNVDFKIGSEIYRWGIYWTLRGGRDIRQMLELINGTKNVGLLRRNNWDWISNTIGMTFLSSLPVSGFTGMISATPPIKNLIMNISWAELNLR